MIDATKNSTTDRKPQARLLCMGEIQHGELNRFYFDDPRLNPMACYLHWYRAIKAAKGRTQ